jgi:hypothetical protein
VASTTHGYLQNASLVSDIGTAFAAGKVVTLDGSAPGTTALPISAYWSHLDIILAAVSGSPTQVQAILCWDSAGDSPASGLSSPVDLQAGLTTTTVRMTSIGLDAWPHRPVGFGTHGKVFCFLKVNSGVVNASIVRLHWRDHLGP